jgi:hypothetical protein
MGLGKTLAMIALIASDAYNPMLDYSDNPLGVLGAESSGITLVIVPPACEWQQPRNTGRIADQQAVLGTWEEELRRYLSRAIHPFKLLRSSLMKILAIPRLSASPGGYIMENHALQTPPNLRG